MLAIKVIDDKQCSSLYAAVMLKSPPMLRYTGPCASPLFHDTQRFFIEQILSNKTREVDLATENILKRNDCVDIQVIALSYMALSKMRLQGCLDEAEAIFRTALEKSRSPECENSLILKGRLLKHYAALLSIMCQYDRPLNASMKLKSNCLTLYLHMIELE